MQNRFLLVCLFAIALLVFEAPISTLSITLVAIVLRRVSRSLLIQELLILDFAWFLLLNNIAIASRAL
ncbi:MULTISPECIES: hypothetical protein [Pseudanabaena]|uniref:Uncharacterized protein n=1 Tax=Pseudanabaena catenata USMAC16 TaxID=1855837 RepID=A0A9X4M4J6_9CYAN|nr:MULTISPECIES: hypothetical protein [Pseudanabaena]MDG3493502.1 hypothetical protein [Pseudanabaena catenata USMAC16]